MSKKYIPKKIEDYSEEELLNLIKIKARRKGMTFDFFPIIQEIEKRKLSQICKKTNK